jgi:hypothetical protein
MDAIDFSFLPRQIVSRTVSPVFLNVDTDEANELSTSHLPPSAP